MKKLALIVLCLLVVGCATTGTSNVAIAPPDAGIVVEAEKEPGTPKVPVEAIGEFLLDTAFGILLNVWAAPMP